MNERISIICKNPENGERLIACVPLQNGEYETGKGMLTVRLGKIRKRDLHQKVIFSGQVIPTVQERGNAQFRKPPQFPRRVVNLPANGKDVVQEVSCQGKIIFRRVESSK